MSNQLVNLNYLVESSLEDEDYVKMMIDMYLKNTPDYLHKINELAEKNELDELKKIAHKFKASVSIMGIDVATNLVQELENNISQNQNLDKTKEIVTEITHYCEQSIIELKALLSSGKKFCS